MSKQDFTTTISVNKTPEEVFAAIMNVRGWWVGTVEGDASQVGDEFTFRYKDVHRTKQKVIEAVPGQKVVWSVLDAYVAVAKNTSEWTGTEIHFDIARKGGKTEVRFTHQGLIPAFECFDACSKGWNFCIGDSLRSSIASDGGQARP